MSGCRLLVQGESCSAVDQDIGTCHQGYEGRFIPALCRGSICQCATVSPDRHHVDVREFIATQRIPAVPFQRQHAVEGEFARRWALRRVSHAARLEQSGGPRATDNWKRGTTMDVSTLHTLKARPAEGRLA